MKLLTKYLIKRLTVMSCYALLSILALYSFIDLLSEIGNIGEGNYTAATAFQYILMQMPARAYQLMPLATLIGGLIALSQLSANSELAVIKTSGLSTINIVGIILKFSAIFAVVTILLGEFLAPHLSRQADALKANAKSGQVSTIHDGVWIKQPQSMVNVTSMLPDNTLLGIKIWRLLHNVQSSVLSDDHVVATQQPEREWISNINNQLLDVLLVQPEQMSFSALTRYIEYLKNNQQQTQAYDVAWWNKLIYPIATMVMSLVALAFTPNSGRHSNMGLKLFGGICLGLLFFFTGRLFGFTTQLYGIPAFISAV